MEITIKQSFYPEHCRKITLKKMSTFYSPPFLYSLHEALSLIFRFFPFQINPICTLFDKLIIGASISVTKARWIIFKTANDLETKILIISK